MNVENKRYIIHIGGDLLDVLFTDDSLDVAYAEYLRRISLFEEVTLVDLQTGNVLATY
jgi:hypothetical protein